MASFCVLETTCGQMNIYKACLFTVFKNCVFILENKENKENTKNMFVSQFFLFFLLKNTYNTKNTKFI